MKFVVLGVMLVMVAGLFHMMFIMYDYLYYDADHGAINMIADIFNDTLLPAYQSRAWNATVLQYEAFGMARFLFIGVAIACFAIEIWKRPQMEE